MSGEGARVDVGGARLEVARHAGAADRAPIVLLHEGLGSVSMWRDFPARLAAATGAEVIAYSRAGYGGSSPARLPRATTYMHDEARSVLPRLLAALGVARPLLVGHSDGASIALIHAAEPASDVAGVVAMAPHLFVEDRSIASIAAARDAWRDTDLPARLGRHHADAAHAFRGWNDIWLHPDFRAWNIEDDVARVRVPVLAIQGEDDEYGTMRQVERIAELRPGTALLALERCRHSPHRDRPEAVLEAIARFAATLDRGHADRAAPRGGGQAKPASEGVDP